uniref:C2H2-type domain-containing protein n=1 Tax=Gibberella zeae TaxID=5518 RepID=A0A4E9EHL3_GIBZA
MSFTKRRGRKAQDPNELVERAILNGLSHDRSRLDPHPVRRNLGEGSKERYNRELMIWGAYEKTFTGSTPLDMQTLKHFAEFLALSKLGRLPQGSGKQLPTAGSVRGAMRRFCNAWERANHTYISLDVKRSMAPYIEGELANKIGLLTGKKGQRKKAFITIENYVHMQNRLWTNDFHDYVHEGSRVDNANLLNTHCFTSARCQELCQAKYKDLECILSWKNGCPEFRLKFTREICKGTNTNQPEHPFAEQVEGPDGMPPPLFAQPMLHWLANLISSRAFADFDTVEQILALEPPKNGNFRILEWADDAQEKPVFPEWSTTECKTKSKNPKSWVTQFSDWGNRAGFTAQLGLHAVRREALIKVNDNGYSLGQVLRFASQSNPGVLVNKYLGSVSTVDGAGSYLGMKLRTDLAEDFRSASVRRNPGLRFSLPARETEELQNSPEYLYLTRKINKINLELEDSKTLEEQTQLEIQRKDAYKQRLLLENKKLKDFQANQKVIYDTNQEDHEQHDWRQNHFSRISHMLPEERVRLAQTLPMVAHPRSPEWITALKDLISLRSNSYPVAYQQELRPAHGLCPVATCGKDLSKIQKKDRWWHVYRCLEKWHSKEEGCARFCFLCSKWLKGEVSWKAHCEDHIAKLAIPIRCNPVTYRHAVACAGYCPVHLGRTDLPVTERMRQWSDQDAWKRHIAHCLSTHLISQRHSKVIACPHPKCPTKFISEKDFWYHQGDIHSVFEKATAITKRKADLGESHLTSGGPQKSKRIEIEQQTGFEWVPLISEGNNAAQKSPYLSDCSTGEISSPSPGSTIGAYGQTDAADIYTSDSSENSSSYTDNDSGIARPGLNSEVFLDRIDEEFLAEGPISGEDNTSLPVDPQLVSGDDIITSCEPVPTIATGTGPMEVTTKGHSNGDTQPHYLLDVSEQEAYLVDALLGRWGKRLFYLRWSDGSYSWEPRENILDDELVSRFEQSYQGFKDGVEVLRTRFKNGKVEYRLHWNGRPKDEDWWVAEKELHPELIEEHKPRKRGCGRRRKRTSWDFI